jgi:hypothetical protein
MRRFLSLPRIGNAVFSRAGAILPGTIIGNFVALNPVFGNRVPAQNRSPFPHNDLRFGLFGLLDALTFKNAKLNLQSQRSNRCGRTAPPHLLPEISETPIKNVSEHRGAALGGW